MTQGSKEVPETRKRDKQAVFQGLLLPRISRLKINRKYNITVFQEINVMVDEEPEIDELILEEDNLIVTGTEDFED